MDDTKTFQFNGTAGGYFVVFLVTAITSYIPIVGWPIGFNYMIDWMTKNTTVNGNQLQYKADFGETLVFLLINMLLLLVTFGIYIFWFMPKMYRYIADHTSIVNAPVVPANNFAAAPATPIAPPTTPQFK